MIKGNNTKIARDLVAIAISIALAIALWQSAIINDLLSQLSQGRLISAFIAGFFFTSAFTTAPAFVLLVKIAQFNSIFLVAIIGAAGAVLGDSLIFYFVRDRLTKDFLNLTKKRRGWLARFRHLLKSKIIRFSLAIMAGFIIALPLLPDETALALMGLSRISTRFFIIITFAFNFLAILGISAAVKYLAV